MIDVKKTLAKVLDFANKNKVITVTGTQTTNAQGAFPIYDKVPLNAEVVSCSITNYANAMAIPFIYNNWNWFVKVVNWQNFSIIGNTSINYIVKYRVGGVVRKLLNTLKMLTSERGWVFC